MLLPTPAPFPFVFYQLNLVKMKDSGSHPWRLGGKKKNKATRRGLECLSWQHPPSDPTGVPSQPSASSLLCGGSPGDSERYRGLSHARALSLSPFLWAPGDNI